MIKHLVGLLLTIYLGNLPANGLAQHQPLPEIVLHRRTDPHYMDSLTFLAKTQFRILIAQPVTPHRDTLRLKTLYYLGRLSMWRNENKDSTFYYGSELVRQARACRNNLYEIAGKVLLESYYHFNQSKIQEAIRLNHEIYASLPGLAFLNIIKYRTLINLSDLYSKSNDYVSAHRYLTNAKEISDFLYEAQKQDELEEILIDWDKDTYFKRQILLTFLIDINQKLGVLYANLSDRVESEKHYLVAEIFLKKDTSTTVRRFMYGAISDFYFTHKRFQQALDYAKKAEAITYQDQLQPQAYQWSLLACQYANLGQYDLADQYAQKVLQQAGQPKIGYKETYMALYQIAQHRQQHRLMKVYHEKYMSLRDTLTAQKANVEISYTEDQGVFTELTLDRDAQADKFMSLGFNFLYILLVMLVILLLLLIYSLRLRKRRAEANLQLANERKEANARIIQTQEAERNRMAADLHDDLGGTLATIHRRFNDLQPYFLKEDLIQDFNSLKILMRKSSADLRRIAHNLMPPEFARIGMRNAIEVLVQNQPLEPTRFSFGVSGRERKLPLETELNAYRVVSELIENINKHAQASQAAVQLIYFDTYLSIIVEDDGIQNDQEKNTQAGSGIGMKSSRLRAEYIGATLRWEWNKGGTMAVLEIPYK